MSASCEWFFELKSRITDIRKILNVLYTIENVSEEKGESVFHVRKKGIFADNGSARNIWGDNYLEAQPDLYIALAKAAPNAKWIASSTCISESGGSGCESYTEVVYDGEKLEFKTENYVDTVTMKSLVDRLNGTDDSYESFCSFYYVDESIDKDIYNEYKNDDCEDDFFFNERKNTVSRHHIWEIAVYSI